MGKSSKTNPDPSGSFSSEGSAGAGGGGGGGDVIKTSWMTKRSQLKSR
jgi:hypothetical protein